MATELNLNNQLSSTPLSCIKGLKIGIVVADWNHTITHALLEGAKETLLNVGYSEDNIEIFHVPGAVELTFAASQLIRANAVGAVIVLGCVIKGGTPHFDYVCDSITQGITYLNYTDNIPVIFGVLTVDNEQQALDRAGGKLGNKGSECAETAIKMCEFVLKIQK